MAQNELYMSWLNDAYSMEVSLVEVMERHADDAEGHPEVQSRIRQHLDETRRHADLMKSRIEDMGGDTSSIKSGMSKLGGMFQGMMTGSADDKLVKNSIMDYGVEHFELASYHALQAAAQDLGDAQTAQMCQEIIRDEESMAKFLEENLPSAVHELIPKQPAAGE